MDLKDKINRIIYKSETKSEKLYDIILILVILLSIVVVIFDSVASISKNFYNLFKFLEWTFTIVFTLDYITRIYVTKNKKGYIFSFFGIVDLIATLPAYLALFFSGLQSLAVIRVIRILRIFRILKMVRYSKEALLLLKAFNDSKRKIIVFLFFLVTIVIIVGSVMTLVEGPENGFIDIPTSMYWSIVTMTTVGFGDITPNTVLGKFLASILMLVGYSIIAIPTGIVTLEMTRNVKKEKLKDNILNKTISDKNIRVRNNKIKKLKCSKCSNEESDLKSKYCRICGKKFSKR